MGVPHARQTVDRSAVSMGRGVDSLTAVTVPVGRVLIADL
jgi:hypothetical protein